MKRRSLIRLLLACGIAAAGIVACKQGKGDRCQIDSDCEPLVCNKATNTCQDNSGGGLDALPAVDARPDSPPDV